MLAKLTERILFGTPISYENMHLFFGWLQEISSVLKTSYKNGTPIRPMSAACVVKV